MTAKSDMHGPTQRERAMIALQEAGFSNAEIAEKQGVSVNYVRRIMSILDVNDTRADKAFFAMSRQGTAQLGRALIAAGGHR